eukprot:5582998-Amphidinium_carterae.2
MLSGTLLPLHLPSRCALSIRLASHAVSDSPGIGTSLVLASLPKISPLNRSTPAVVVAIGGAVSQRCEAGGEQASGPLRASAA